MIKSFITKVKMKWLANHIHRQMIKKVKKDYHLKSNKEAEEQLRRILESITEVFIAIEKRIDDDNADEI